MKYTPRSTVVSTLEACTDAGLQACVKIDVEAIVMPHAKQINRVNDLGYKSLHVHVYDIHDIHEKSNVQCPTSNLR